MLDMATRECHTLNWIRNFRKVNGNDNVGAMYHALGQKNIKLIFVPGKLLLSGMKVPNFNDNMTAECNGLVYSTTDDRILVLPPPLCSTKVDISNIQLNATDKVYNVLDGTVLNLYYDSEWILSTTNAIDATQTNISNQILTNRYNRPDNIHYQTLFDEAVAQYPDFSRDALDKNCCYSIVMFHHAIHPFVQAYTMKVWLARCTNTETFIDSLPDIGLPIQEELTNITTAEMRDKNASAISDYINNPDIPPHFGYIVRRTESSNTPYNIIIPSTLFECIKSMCYESNLNRIIKTNNYDKYLYIAINSFMRQRDTYNGHNKFVALLGDPLNLYHTFCEIAEKVVDRLVMRCHNTTLPDDYLTSTIQPIITNCFKYFRMTRELRTDSRKLRAALANNIVHQRYTLVYYDLLLDNYYDNIYPRATE
jgi:hypothetical protein